MNGSNFCECTTPKPGHKEIKGMPICRHCGRPIDNELKATEEVLREIAKTYREKTGKNFFSIEE